MTHKYKRRLLVCVACFVAVLLMVAVLIAILVRPLSAPQAFRNLVCNPIPRSVEEIKLDRHRGFLGLVGHRYVFHFRIEEPDLSAILNSKPFEEVEYIKYDETGFLWWGYHHDVSGKGAGLRLYRLHSGETEPEWFGLEQWDSPRVYVFLQKDVIRVRLLVYNEDLGEAYFIDILSPD